MNHAYHVHFRAVTMVAISCGQIYNLDSVLSDIRYYTGKRGGRGEGNEKRVGEIVRRGGGVKKKACLSA